MQIVCYHIIDLGVYQVLSLFFPYYDFGRFFLVIDVKDLKYRAFLLEHFFFHCCLPFELHDSLGLGSLAFQPIVLLTHLSKGSIDEHRRLRA